MSFFCLFSPYLSVAWPCITYIRQKEPCLTPFRAPASVKAPAALTATVSHETNLKALNLAILLQRGTVLPFLFYTGATEAGAIWYSQAGSTPRSPKLTPQLLTYTETVRNKSPTGTKVIQAELCAFPRLGECQHRSRTCVGGWCLGPIRHWNFDIITCIFSLFRWYLVLWGKAVLYTYCGLYNIVFNYKIKQFFSLLLQNPFSWTSSCSLTRCHDLKIIIFHLCWSMSVIFLFC